MATKKVTQVVLDEVFDSKDCRHYLNGKLNVLHCHHYATLYTQLADDCTMLDAKQMLAECAEDAFYAVLSSYYEAHGLTSIADRVAIAEEYYAVVGLGKMKVEFLGSEGGAVELVHSHVDEGWIKKWGKRDEPVNFIGSGYIAALFAAVLGKPTRSFDVREIASIVSGANKSEFVVAAN
ncbi:MAG TPA: hypothetical protein DGT21_01960 [Armatimonadetes bacterium]|nr:hypothetical protein [Armatimonadota bacterium]